MNTGFRLEEDGREKKELAKISEAGGDVHIIGKNIQDRRKPSLSDAVSAQEPFLVKTNELEGVGGKAHMNSKVGSSRADPKG